MPAAKNSGASSPTSEEGAAPQRLPEWLRIRLPQSSDFVATGGLLRDLGLHTVCQGARCPNIFECFSKQVATFLILGGTCSRSCGFCNIGHHSRDRQPLPLDPDEPRRVAEAAGRLGLRHVVVTSVTRDDLPDGGAAHFAAVIRALRAALPQAGIEVLIPDFQGSPQALDTVLAAGPDILNHNVETVPQLYPVIRPQAVYARSLKLLARAHGAGVRTKSGFMVGLGETDAQVAALLADLAAVPCDTVTIGQYLPPTRHHPRPTRYVTPERFAAYAEEGRRLGLVMHSAPLVRSSYQAERVARETAPE